MTFLYNLQDPKVIAFGKWPTPEFERELLSQKPYLAYNLD